MAPFFYYTVLTLLVAVAVILILLILIQKGRGGGLSSAFGGGGGSSAFGAKTGDVLTWATSIIFFVFIILAVSLDLIVDSQFKSIASTAAPSSSSIPVSAEQPAPGTQPTSPALPPVPALPATMPAISSVPAAPQVPRTLPLSQMMVPITNPDATKIESAVDIAVPPVDVTKLQTPFSTPSPATQPAGSQFGGMK